MKKDYKLQREWNFDKAEYEYVLYKRVVDVEQIGCLGSVSLEETVCIEENLPYKYQRIASGDKGWMLRTIKHLGSSIEYCVEKEHGKD